MKESIFDSLGGGVGSSASGGMEGAKAGVPKPELVHKLEGCTDEVRNNLTTNSFLHLVSAPGEWRSADSWRAGGDLHLQVIVVCLDGVWLS